MEVIGCDIVINVDQVSVRKEVFVFHIILYRNCWVTSSLVKERWWITCGLFSRVNPVFAVLNVFSWIICSCPKMLILTSVKVLIWRWRLQFGKLNLFKASLMDLKLLFGLFVKRILEFRRIEIFNKLWPSIGCFRNFFDSYTFFE